MKTNRNQTRRDPATTFFRLGWWCGQAPSTIRAHFTPDHATARFAGSVGRLSLSSFGRWFVNRSASKTLMGCLSFSLSWCCPTSFYTPLAKPRILES
jgi:hypothetical protein